jgi:hypothetical protein
MLCREEHQVLDVQCLICYMVVAYFSMCELQHLQHTSNLLRQNFSRMLLPALV